LAPGNFTFGAENPGKVIVAPSSVNVALVTKVNWPGGRQGDIRHRPETVGIKLSLTHEGSPHFQGFIGRYPGGHEHLLAVFCVAAKRPPVSGRVFDLQSLHTPGLVYLTGAGIGERDTDVAKAVSLHCAGPSLVIDPAPQVREHELVARTGDGRRHDW